MLKCRLHGAILRTIPALLNIASSTVAAYLPSAAGQVWCLLGREAEVQDGQVWSLLGRGAGGGGRGAAGQQRALIPRTLGRDPLAVGTPE